MRFYTVWVRSISYRGTEPLTYSCTQKLLPGAVVLVPLQKEMVLGFAVAEVPKPAFATKPIQLAYDLPNLPKQISTLAAWLRDFYATNLGTIGTLLLPAGFTAQHIEKSSISVVTDTIKASVTSLNSDQLNAVKKVTKADTYLLHGRTGSGKTRVYIELALAQIEAGKSVIVLTPEIGLTSQLAQSFQAVFGNRVVILHSQLTAVERQKIWLQILQNTSINQPLIIIGPRSALFSPVSNLGLIVIDEAHEPAYKQEQAPYYHARSVASKLVELHSASLIIGSATPSITDYFLAEQRHKPILRMSSLARSVAMDANTPISSEHSTDDDLNRPSARGVSNSAEIGVLAQPNPAISNKTLEQNSLSNASGTAISVSAELLAPQADGRPRSSPVERSEETGMAVEQQASLTKFTIIDLKDRGQFTRSQQLSQPLLEAMQASLGRGEQSLIYLNRRGTARVVLCENCGWQALCPHCDLPLIYHADNGKFRCHTCGYQEDMRTACPACGHPSVLFKTFGTKAITEEVMKLFPGARVQRFDTDNLKAERFETHYEAVKRGEVDILVGTQLLAKGLDLPKLSTLGIIQADSSLGLPDFSATERTYQLISQALGRVGRGHVEGHAIIQTYHPDNPMLQAAIKDDYTSFYETELAERRAFHFPPFYYLLKLSTRRASYKSAEAAAQKLKDQLNTAVPNITIDGPTPSFYEKFQGKYQCQLVVRSTQRSNLLAVVKQLPSGWTYDIDPINLL